MALAPFAGLKMRLAIFLLVPLLLICRLCSAEFYPRRVYAYQRQVVRQEQQQQNPPTSAAGNKSASTAVEQTNGAADTDPPANNGNNNNNNAFLICDKGKPVKGVCVCEDGFVGKYCERKMHCLNEFGRAQNGSCLNCTDTFTGPHCDRPICQNGGVQLENESQQNCQCEPPYSGQFCTDLRMEDVYMFYNSRAAIIGPLGIFLIVPMIACFVLCERKARHRQVYRIQQAWANEKNINAKKLDGKRIESLLKGKEMV